MRAASVSVIPLVVCDDSNMARKQVLRALPADWAVSVTEAGNGRQAMDAIRKGLGQVVLLDLTMPEMDGYQVLSALRDEGLKAQVIVISGDVQEEAVRRVLELGALAFLKKPFDESELRQILNRLGLLTDHRQAPQPDREIPNTAINFHDAFRETVNVAIGRAAALIAKVLGVFVQLPVPNVNVLEVGELHMALSDASSCDQLTAICQGFIGSGIAGEALLMFHDSEVADIAQLMQRQSEDYSDLEMLLDLSSVLIGACLSSIAEQIDVVFSQGHPQILGQHAAIDELIRVNQKHWKKTLAVEISYSLEGHDIRFDLLLLFTEDSIERLTHKLAYLMS
ncbi:response regulator [Pseudomonas sp. SMN5]|uniref:response regulator n=1 Tax=Pseudomonas sp. SMN5 TaxID=3390198 RepID=UPI003F83DF96